MLFFEDPHHPWRHENQDGNILYFKGDAKTARDALKLVQVTSIQRITAQLSNHFSSITHYTAGAIETERLIIAWADHIRSWPIFYTLQHNDIVIANSARKLQEKTGLNAISNATLLEFAMSGFVSGEYTLVQDLLCLQPGEFVIFDKAQSSLITERYFQYTPDYSCALSQEDKKQKLGQILDESIKELITKAKDRTIWVLLSAGLDSRILLCKLHEHGYENLQTFTYGPSYNFEAMYAKKIAQTLGVPWRLIPQSKAQMKDFYQTSKRQDYWRYADNLKAIPCMGGLAAMFYLHEHNIAQPGDIFINGQSGDFITGGHIFSSWFDQKTINAQSFTDKILTKHYSLWHSLKTEPNNQIMGDKIDSLIDTAHWEEQSDLAQRAAQLERWEYDARQVCYVINGQRIYEFLGYEWDMPLWDKRLVQFYQTLSLDDKNGQSLYKHYLKSYNYKNLFPETEPNLWRWPLPMLWVIPMANLLNIFKGKKKEFYALMRYFGHYADQYSAFSFKDHRRTYKNARNVTSLSVRQWLLDHQFDLGDQL